MCQKYPSVKWIDRFVQRHPEVALHHPSGIDPKRAQGFNYTIVKKHFEDLESLLKQHDILWENIKGGSLDLVTVIESVCADGTSLHPGFIFAGGVIDRESTEVDPDIVLATSENGWTSDYLCSEWFKQSFIPQVATRNQSGRPIVLIYDGHGSHVTSEMIETAIAHNILLFALPPHTTHRLQPLDVGIFGPMQKAWSKQCEEYSLRTGEGMQRCDVVEEYMKAWEKAFRESTILQAW
ncbi:hypothetical protein M404DRAFT_17369 [Pisolithus tinctorius Marx 270]|uniref:DDE-1 domain-containing protein n=1 Tax=Pisolithus tinctorius Marx 270 TaxID=870435 RepID=A0A0C3J5F0_PISTI|nr:hypothetical protein M404DRAFT_17369 [Pisolithus tinctorius Marx 270]